MLAGAFQWGCKVLNILRTIYGVYSSHVLLDSIAQRDRILFRFTLAYSYSYFNRLVLLFFTS